MTSRRIVFVCHTAAGESLRSAQAIAKLDDVKLVGIVSGVHDTEQLIAAARSYGNVYKIVTNHETLLLPVAEANEALGVRSMSSETVKRTLDKSRLKAILKQAGIKTPRHQMVTNAADAQRFASEVGFPIIIKPVGGSGALTTFEIRHEEQLVQVLELIQPPVIAEAFVIGQELCFDTITVDNEPQFYTLCEYNPPILNALQDPERRWRCLMPRQINDKYQEFIAQGLAAVRALQVGTTMTHMEGFLNGGFIDATLRPAGARIGPMFGFACDVDPYRVWARVAIDGGLDGPLEHKFAVGTIFLRGPGSGLVEHVTGVGAVCEKLGDLLVEAHWPKVGAAKSPTYTGDGFITVRHRDAGVVEEALDLIDQTVKIAYSSPKPDSGIGVLERLRNYRSLNKPAWETTL